MSKIDIIVKMNMVYLASASFRFKVDIEVSYADMQSYINILTEGLTGINK